MRFGLLACLVLALPTHATFDKCQKEVSVHAARLARIAVSLGNDGSLIIAADAEGNLFRAFDSGKRIGATLEPHGFLVPLVNPSPGKSILALSTVYTGERGGSLPGFIATVQSNAVYLTDPMLRVSKLWVPEEDEQIQSVALALNQAKNRPDRIRAFVGTSQRIALLDIPAALDAGFDGLSPTTLLEQGSDHLYALSPNRLIYSNRSGDETYEIFEWYKGEIRTRGKVEMDLRTLGAVTAGSHLTIHAHGFVDGKRPDTKRRAAVFRWHTRARSFVERNLGRYQINPSAYAVSRAQPRGLAKPGAHQITDMFHQAPVRLYPFWLTSELIVSDGQIQAITRSGLIQPDWTLLPIDPNSAAAERYISGLLSDREPLAVAEETAWRARQLQSEHQVHELRAPTLASSWILAEQLARYLRYPNSKIPRSLETLEMRTEREQMLLLFLADSASRERMLRLSGAYLFEKDVPVAVRDWAIRLRTKFNPREDKDLSIVAESVSEHTGMHPRYCLRFMQDLGRQMSQENPAVLIGDLAERTLEALHPLWNLRSVLGEEDAVDSLASEPLGENK